MTFYTISRNKVNADMWHIMTCSHAVDLIHLTCTYVHKTIDLSCFFAWLTQWSFFYNMHNSFVFSMVSFLVSSTQSIVYGPLQAVETRRLGQ